MKIGTDVNLKECRKQGYAVVEFPVKGLYPDGRKAGMDTSYGVRYTKSNPDYWPDGRPDPDASHSDLYITDIDVCWDVIVEIYINNKVAIDNMCGYDCSEGYDLDNPNEDLLVIIADAVDSYCGLE